jgi:hypothetical protein
MLSYGVLTLLENGGARGESREEEEEQKSKPGLRADEPSCRRPRRGAKFGLRLQKVTKERETNK